MPFKTVVDDLKTYFKTNFTALGSRVFIVPTEASYLLMESYKTPGMSIVYAGGTPVESKGVKAQSEKYLFDLYIYQTIWGEEKVMEGDGAEKGLMELRTICKGLIENINIHTDFTDNIYLIGITDFKKTNEWLNDTGGLSSWIGMGIVIKEQ